jgi:hypothetical protein
MKTVLANLALASTVVAKTTYDGHQALRIVAGEDVTELQNVINSLELPTWKGVTNGVPRANALVDVVVSPEKLDTFTELTANMTVEVMHEDLGASIAAEAQFEPYAGRLKTEI